MIARVLQPITHHGRPYAAGDRIEVDAAVVGQLVAAGVIALIPVEPVKPAAPAPAKGREA